MPCFVLAIIISQDVYKRQRVCSLFLLFLPFSEGKQEADTKFLNWSLSISYHTCDAGQAKLKVQVLILPVIWTGSAKKSHHRN